MGRSRKPTNARLRRLRAHRRFIGRNRPHGSNMIPRRCRKGEHLEEVTEAMRATLLETQEEIKEIALEEEMVRRALDLLGSQLLLLAILRNGFARDQVPPDPRHPGSN